jgi:Zn-dependent protease with chaperone function
MSQPDLQSTDTYYFSVVHYHPIALLIALLLAALIIILPYWKIFGKAGFPRILGIFMIIPLINLILLYVLAFSQWRVLPSQTDNR